MIHEPPSEPPTLGPGMPGYVLRDWKVVDYDCYQLGDTGMWFRGPQQLALEPAKYFCVLGAAQSFGCFVASPYPALLEQKLGLRSLNLGYSGAGPDFFSQRPALLEYVNDSAFCIVQVMSARSTSNSAFRNPEGLAHGRRTSDGSIATAEEVFGELLAASLSGLPGGNRRISRALLKATRFPLPGIRRAVTESRDNWTRSMQQLLAAIDVPTILFWFSTREPAYRPSYHDAGWLLGAYPQLVNKRMLDRVRSLADEFVCSTSAEGLPQPLVDRFTGAPVTVVLESDLKSTTGLDEGAKSLYRGTWSENAYYPSPQMHHAAARALEATCRRLINTGEVLR